MPALSSQASQTDAAHASPKAPGRMPFPAQGPTFRRHLRASAIRREEASPRCAREPWSRIRDACLPRRDRRASHRRRSGRRARQPRRRRIPRRHPNTGRHLRRAARPLPRRPAEAQRTESASDASSHGRTRVRRMRPYPRAHGPLPWRRARVRRRSCPHVPKNATDQAPKRTKSNRRLSCATSLGDGRLPA